MTRAPTRYDSITIALHWSIGIGIVAIGLTEMLRGEIFAKGSPPRELLKAFHEPAGLVLLGLIALRLLWRLSHTAPLPPPTMRPWELLAAKLTHLGLYTLMVALPLLGLATAYARGRPLNVGFTQIPLPPTALVSKSVARFFKETHEIAFDLLLALAFAHALAAIWHHVVRKDDVLTRMLPGRAG